MTTTDPGTVADLFRRAIALAAADPDLAARPRRTTVRALRSLLPEPPATPPPDPADLPPPDPDEQLLELARDLLRRCADDPRPALLEACAAALRLVQDAPDAELRTRLDQLPTVDDTVLVRTDGPYLLTGRATVTTWLGEPVETPSVAALCRCGRSGSRPWCDGTHAEIGFTGAGRPDRVPDRLHRYPARQFDIQDNRGRCAHSGRCTDALPVAFRAGTEPFVAAAGARADDLLRAVRACPSGALGAALAGREAPELVDTDREPSVEVAKDGPYRVTGGVPLLDEDRSEVHRPEGPRRSTTACAGAGSRRTSRSAAARTGTPTSTIRCRCRTRNRRCSAGQAVSPRCCAPPSCSTSGTYPRTNCSVRCSPGWSRTIPSGSPPG